MAVPKKRTGASAQGHRRSNWKATKPETTKCSKCGEVVLTHTVCTACGYYKGKAVSIKSPNYVETTVETKKPTKKAAKVKEAKAEVKEAKAEVKEAKAEVKEAKAEVKEAKAEVKEAKAEVKEAVEEIKAEEKIEE